MKTWILALTLLIGGLMTDAQAVTLPEGKDPENLLVMELKDGPVIIEMLPEKAPTHVARIKELTREGFYDGVVFHRVIDGFMAQTGDPTGTGTGGSGKKLKAEFNDVKHKKGTVSMARAASPDSADSQFFIVFEAAPHLNGQYTAWGQVISGMEYVDAIKKGDSYDNGSVTDPDKVISMKVGSDIAK
ncbi:MAG: peptidylprolyl isomerase [Rickettsiales bacterium]|nr:peptidylprolyl isomerase [Rickettsiales bacterium]